MTTVQNTNWHFSLPPIVAFLESCNTIKNEKKASNNDILSRMESITTRVLGAQLVVTAALVCVAIPFHITITAFQWTYPWTEKRIKQCFTVFNIISNSMKLFSVLARYGMKALLNPEKCMLNDNELADMQAELLNAYVGVILTYQSLYKQIVASQKGYGYVIEHPNGANPNYFEDRLGNVFMEVKFPTKKWIELFTQEYWEYNQRNKNSLRDCVGTINGLENWHERIIWPVVFKQFQLFVTSAYLAEFPGTQDVSVYSAFTWYIRQQERDARNQLQHQIQDQAGQQVQADPPLPVLPSVGRKLDKDEKTFEYMLAELVLQVKKEIKQGNYYNIATAAGDTQATQACSVIGTFRLLRNASVVTDKMKNGLIFSNKTGKKLIIVPGRSKEFEKNNLLWGKNFLQYLEHPISVVKSLDTLKEKNIDGVQITSEQIEQIMRLVELELMRLSETDFEKRKKELKLSQQLQNIAHTLFLDIDKPINNFVMSFIEKEVMNMYGKADCLKWSEVFDWDK